MASYSNVTVSADAAIDALRDEDGVVRREYVDRVDAAVEAGDGALLRELVGDLHEADAGDLIEALDPDMRTRLIELMGGDFDFTALTEVDDAIREEILDSLSAGTVAAGVRELDSDDAVYLLEDLPKADQIAILQELPSPERIALERSLYYPDESAGRRMQTEFIAVPPFWTVGQTIDHMRETPDLPERFFEIYVIDPAYRLVGAVALDKLLRTKRPVAISELVDEDQRRVRATEDQEEVARQFERYNLVAALVVDDAGRLVGVITVDDVLDVMNEEADEDLKALGGVQAEEELSDTVWEIAKSRFPWLLANMVTAFMAASVIRMFEDSIAQMVALAVLMPIVASMGGNAGMQTMTVAVRALATRDLDEIVAIEAASFNNPWTRDMYERELQNPDVSFLYVLRVPGQGIVAFCSFWLVLDEVHINNLAVRGDFRGRGLGTALLGHVLQAGASRGAGRATLEVRRSNAPARRLYESLGFEIAATRPNYYVSPAEDALILWRDVTLPLL